ncbi:MAG: tetratricopeptide repeat protein [Armatimonadota bacterium]
MFHAPLRLPPLALALAAALLACAPGLAGVADGRKALHSGDYAAAEKALKAAPAAEKAPAALALAELYRLTGRYPEALQAAAQAAAVKATQAAALTLTGEVLHETGKSAEAIGRFREALKADPRHLRARIYLGTALQETGKEAEAEAVLDQFFEDFNAGKIDAEKADQLTYTAMAARRLKAWQDASSTFQQAAEKDPQFLLANLEWGELFLAKYNAAEAVKCFQEVLKINENHPRALTGMASVIVETSYDVPKATALADAALKQNPKYVPAFNLKARLALDNEEFASAEALLKKSLAVNPADLEALSLLAASRYLQDDTAGYTAHRQKVLAQNPRFSDFYFIVGELAVRQHRYEDAVTLNREAVKLDAENANALAALATNLMRRGISGEEEALKLLEQAFELDPFNVRTFNTLNLYEEVIAKDYTTFPSGPFIFRLSKKEKPLLERYVPQLMQRAWDAYVKKYGFTPKGPVTVELFTQRPHYGARTTGLPEIGAQGTCFGPLVTAMSPGSAEASWELVLWHELGHVFHLALSKNRSARWFTEGLAEYETNIERPHWKREHALEIYQSLERGNLWKISELSAAFTRPDRPNGVVIAYQQSSLVIHYLAETFGFPKIVQALKMYGEGKQDAEILPAVTGKSLDQLDAGFRDYLRRRYEHYVKGFQFDPERYSDTAKLKAEALAKISDANAQAALAAALLEDAAPAAVEQARKALALDGKHALARFVLAAALSKTGDAAGARTELETLLKNGVDGYPVRLALGRFAAGAGDLEATIEHLNAAKKWDPDRAEPYNLLMQLYQKQERRDDLLKETEAYLDLQEHEHEAARLLIDQYSLDERWEDVVRVAPRVISITPNETYVHQVYGAALAHLKRHQDAIYELESALAGGVRKPGAVRGLLAKQYLLAGDKAKAKAAAEQALKDEPSNADAAEVLKGL